MRFESLIIVSRLEWAQQPQRIMGAGVFVRLAPDNNFLWAPFTQSKVEKGQSAKVKLIKGRALLFLFYILIKNI